MSVSTSQNHLRTLAISLLVAGMVTVFPAPSVAQQADARQQVSSTGSPLTELVFDGLLARNASWNYLSYLVRTRGLGFSPSSRLLKQINAAGGGVIVPALRTTKVIPAHAQNNKPEQKLIQRLGRCAEFADKGDYSKAVPECSAAREIDPKSPWPIMGLAAIAIESKKYADALPRAHQAVDLAPMMAEAHFTLGEALAENDQGPGAADELEEALHLDPDHVDALVLLGDLYENSAKPDNHYDETALTYYQRAAALVPGDPDTHERLASVYSKRGEWAAAVEEYKTLEKLDPQNADWPRNEGKLLFDSKNYTDAVSAYGRVLQIKPSDTEAYYWRGSALVGGKKYTAAVADLLKAHAANPKRTDVLLELGLAQGEAGQFDDAIANLKRDLDVDPKYCAPMVTLGWVYEQTGRHSESLEEYEKAVQCESDNPVALRDLASELTNAGGPEESEPLLKHLVEVAPSDVNGRIMYGVVFDRLNRLDDAEAQYRKAIELAPANSMAHEDLCKLLHKKQDYAAAVTECRKAISLESGNAEIWDTLGIELGHEKQFTAAVTAFREAVRIDPGSSRYHSDLGWALQDEGLDNEAVQEYQTALADNPNLGDIWIRLGDAQLHLKHYDAAITANLQAVKLNPLSSLAFANLGSSYFEDHRLTEATAALKKSMTINPDYLRAYLLLSQVMRNSGDRAGEISQARIATENEPESAPAWIVLSYALLGAKQFQNAVTAAQKAIALDPRSPPFHETLGQIYKAMDDNVDALREFRTMHELEPNDLNLMYLYALELQRSGDVNAAVPVYQEILRQNPQMSGALAIMGMLVAAHGDLNSAVSYEEKAVAAAPQLDLALSNLAQYLVQSGNAEKGLVYAERAVAAHPDSPLAQSALSKAQAGIHNWPAAVAAAREALRLDPKNVARQFQVVTVLVQSGDTVGGMTEFQKILQEQPNSSGQWASFGELLMNIHDFSSARDALQKAVALDSKNALALNNLAWFYATCADLKFRNPAEALRLGKQANDLTNWKNPDYIDTYAAALAACDDPVNAANAERQALSLQPQRTDFQTALKKYESDAAKKNE